MRDRHGIPLSRDAPLSGDRLRSNPEPAAQIPARPFSFAHWQGRAFLVAGIIAAVILTNTAIRTVAGLSAPAQPSPLIKYEIPSFADLVECDAHFSHEILRIKNKMPALNDTEDLPLLHRNYRRLHRLLRQVGRRDGVPSAVQTEMLRRHVNRFNTKAATGDAAPRDNKCKQMAELPIARKRQSQLIVGR
jgi:hypothetical protein